MLDWLCGAAASLQVKRVAEQMSRVSFLVIAFAIAMSVTPASGGGRGGSRFRNDGGFYGGGGVFYGDNGYSRVVPVLNYRPSQHVFDLTERPASGSHP
ncbi:hypothetical protein OGR47_06495 [Methylocystis sp. MJC1]|jgi:hypothetical protein|uniref:hypothetical protein n=1 Tax=Methylocystis sp. MJC1 TaxID=2654282 RepID=UPI001C1E45C7|nr:hypothetical protein [Methylocystis sp. MJC1]KAF2992684.1 hypothetical protein MJC1_00262 [Methylocystis sp. MJC1]MBU6526649.1 hypothetical protein [Methylocystis sp. MJC1]UZX13091.1 hypothetical protein OGR47_06495 [Methylocystis sp. MJC1]